MSMLPISRSLGISRDFHLVSSDAPTSDLMESQRRESDFENIYIYDANDISRIAHTYGTAKERENTSPQVSVSPRFYNWAQDSELTSDYEFSNIWTKRNASYFAESIKAENRWDLVTFPVFLKGAIAGVPDSHLRNFMQGWGEMQHEVADEELSIFTTIDATIRWNPVTFSGFLKTAIANMPDTQLLDALHDWNRVKHEAIEEGFPLPTDIALENSRRMLIDMYSISSRRFEVYPTPDGEIAIDVSGGFRRSVLLLCNSDGGALCLVNINGEFRRAHYSDTDKLPDGFIREALVELE